MPPSFVILANNFQEMLVVAFASEALKRQHRLQVIIETRCMKQNN